MVYLELTCQYLKNLLLFLLRLFWNTIITALIVIGFVLWFCFIFGSVLGVILILIFMPSLFLLPLLLASMYTKIWNVSAWQRNHHLFKTEIGYLIFVSSGLLLMENLVSQTSFYRRIKIDGN